MSDLNTTEEHKQKQQKLSVGQCTNFLNHLLGPYLVGADKAYLSALLAYLGAFSDKPTQSLSFKVFVKLPEGVSTVCPYGYVSGTLEVSLDTFKEADTFNQKVNKAIQKQLQTKYSSDICSQFIIDWNSIEYQL